MDYPKHRIYALLVEGEIFYIGYSQRNLDQRLREHLDSAQNPTNYQLMSEAIRGEESAKRKVINTALKEGWSVTIECLAEEPTYVPLDEQYFIEQYRQEGHCLTNVATGSVWQHHVLVDGELIEVDKTASSARIRETIQEFKRNKRHAPPKCTHVTKPQTLTPQEKYDLFARELSTDMANYIFRPRIRPWRDLGKDICYRPENS